MMRAFEEGYNVQCCTPGHDRNEPGGTAAVLKAKHVGLPQEQRLAVQKHAGPRGLRRGT